MQMLYDSETFVVMALQPDVSVTTEVSKLANETESSSENGTKKITPKLERYGFEIVDKRVGKEVYLDGSWAELFQQHLRAWQENAPTQEEVEATLESYSGLAQTSVAMQ